MNAFFVSDQSSPLPLRRVLVVRNDGLGDFILTLPLMDALARRGAKVWVLTSSTVAPLVECLPWIAGVVIDKGVLLKRDVGRFSAEQVRCQRADLLKEVRALQVDAAFLPYAESASARLIHQSDIPVRVGSLRRWFSWRFNRFEAIGRQRSGLAEYWLNLCLLESAGLPAYYYGLPPLKSFPISLSMWGLSTERPLVVLHALKSTNTALSWPQTSFIDLAHRFHQAGWQTVVIGNESERYILANAWKSSPFIKLLTTLSLSQLAALLRQAKLFIGNSSGPLHLAALVGTPHIGLYPQNLASSPVRWRTLPLQPHDAPAPFSVSPENLLYSRFPKNCVLCEKNRCPYFDCVASIQPQQVWQRLQQLGII